MSIQRFNHDGRPHPYGVLVGYDDHLAAIAAERERADRAEADRNAAEARAEQSDDECRYAQDLVIRQGDLLRKTVNALRGPPPDDTLWSVHDAPELAVAVAAERDALRERVARLQELILHETGEDEDGNMPHEPREALLILRRTALEDKWATYSEYCSG